MLKLKRIALAACAWAAIAMPPAMAADIPVYEPVPVPPPVVGGWYLRGDIGYKIWADPEVDWDDSAAGLDFDDEDLDDTGMIGVGVGYRFNRWFRADLTVDYEWPSDFEGTTICPAPCGGAGVVGTNVESGELSAITTLANLYIDLGYWNGFSPYVGAGAGFAYLMMDDIVTEDAVLGSIDLGDADDWTFAWALMAGLAYEFTPNLALDVGYRYLNLGSLETDTLTEIGVGDGTFTYDDLQAHEIRVGMRYTFY
jgi:opacity protein-like surface antigen